MRTIFRLCLVATVVAAVGLAAVPTASAKKAGRITIGHISITPFEKKQNRKIRRAKRKANHAHERIDSLRDWNFGLSAKNQDQDEAFNALKAIVDTGVPIITQALTDLEGGLLALQAALEDDVAPALEAIDAALNDPVTGLVGLNLARPQFGVYDDTGAFLGGTGDAGGSGPIDEPATQGSSGPPDLDGLFVVDFHNDVSSRMYTVNVFPYTPPDLGGGTTPYGSAINCVNPGIDTVCGLVQGGAADADPNKVLVQIGSGEDGGAANGFSVTALSG